LRRTTSAVMGIAVALVLWSGTPAQANLHTQYTRMYHQVVHRFNKRAPGRNIDRWGVVDHHGNVRHATFHELAKSIRTMKGMLHPPVYTRVSRVGPPPIPPSGSLTPRLAPSGLASCIVSRESGGDPTASNGSHTGIAQWSPEAWSRMGGHRYAPTPTGASYQEQLVILSDGLARYGCQDWCPFDGC
jgi:hypothetical protein